VGNGSHQQPAQQEHWALQISKAGERGRQEGYAEAQPVKAWSSATPLGATETTQGLGRYSWARCGLQDQRWCLCKVQGMKQG
jgi:hypothetical protein